MTHHSSSEIKHNIFVAVKKKIGNINIHLELTPNNKARLTIASHRVRKDFMNQRDALQWLIYTYNLKHLKKSLENCRSQEVVVNHEAKKRNQLNDAARDIFDEIEKLDYFTTEMFRNIVKQFDLLKLQSGFRDEEIGQVYRMVLDLLQKLLDQTINHRAYEVYKKYFEQLRIKGYRQ